MIESPPTVQSSRLDDIAYVAPMATFLALTTLGGGDGLFPLSYIAKTAIVAVMLVYFWPRFTRIRWTHLGLGAVAGTVGIVQWIGVQKLINAYAPWMVFGDTSKVFNPFAEFATPTAAWAFITIRLIGAVLVVPVMEELFWRDYLQRTLAAPNDFKMLPVGYFDRTAFFGVAIAFCVVHPAWWLTAILYGLLIGGLLAYTRSLGSAIVCHAVSNLLLGVYVLWTGDWFFW